MSLLLRFTIFAIIICSLTGMNCHKSNSCTEATIVQTSDACQLWSVKISDKQYPSADIPDQYRQAGLKVCITYSLYEDSRLCICCGGTWISVKTIVRL